VKEFDNRCQKVSEPSNLALNVPGKAAINLQLFRYVARIGRNPERHVHVHEKMVLDDIDHVFAYLHGTILVEVLIV